jgi:formylglycine-generating enzyme required for sulfatase activity
MFKAFVSILVFSCISFAQENPYFKEAFDKFLREKPRNCTGLCETKFRDDAKKKATEEAAKKMIEEAAAKKVAEEAAKKAAAEEEAAKKIFAEEAAKKAAEEAAARKAAEEEAAWKAAEEAAKRTAEEEVAKKAAAEEAARKAVAEEAARKAAAEEAAIKAAAEAAAIKAAAEAAAKRTAEEEATKKAAEEAAKRAELKELEVEMIFVKGGIFTMGCTSEQQQSGDCNENESPIQTIELNDYYVSKHPITQRLWLRVMGSNPSSFSGPNLPVESISWLEAQEFIKKLNFLTGKKYRLLTEAEWEYAARGGANVGSRRRKFSGDDNLDKVAWFINNSEQRTHNVCTKQPNELGICDMSGNVWEWVNDWNGNYTTGLKKNPHGPSKGTLRVNRGGSFQDGTVQCRVSRRNGNRPEYRSPNLGFRLALER